VWFWHCMPVIDAVRRVLATASTPQGRASELRLAASAVIRCSPALGDTMFGHRLDTMFVDGMATVRSGTRVLTGAAFCDRVSMTAVRATHVSGSYAGMCAGVDAEGPVEHCDRCGDRLLPQTRALSRGGRQRVRECGWCAWSAQECGGCGLDRWRPREVAGGAHVRSFEGYVGGQQLPAATSVS